MESGIQSSTTGGGGPQTTNISALLNSHLQPTTLTSLTNLPQSQSLSLSLFQLHYSFNHDDAYYHHTTTTNNNNYNFDPPTFSQSMMINNHNNNNNISNSKDHTSLGVVVWPNNNPNNQQLQSQPLQQQQAPLAPAGSGKRDHQGIIGGVRLNPTKKRSRRTPTTVLATDTNNFRQMVQEFTGIPASPFESPPLHLFGGLGIQIQFPRARARARARETSMLDVSTSAMQPLPYLMSPFPHKIVAPRYLINNNHHQTKATTEECQVGTSLIGLKPTISIGDTMVGGTASNVNTGIARVGNR